jgi:tripartite-type tricarboxylate transporter receptor subunit TctC
MPAPSAGMTIFVVAALAILLLAAGANAVDFRGKSVSMIIGSEPGGGTDTSGRLLAAFFEKYLPGNPTIVVRNMPGAEGVTALNYVVQQTKPDGLTFVTGAAVQLSPLTYRKAKGVYDPVQLRYIGGIGRGGTQVLVNRASEWRLTDKNAAPLFAGVRDGTSGGEQIPFWAIAFLGWNARPIAGYRGTTETLLALEREEIDLATTGSLQDITKLVETGRFKVALQTGALRNGEFRPLPRADLAAAPVLASLMRDKEMSEAARQAYSYWQSVTALDKWVGLTAGTPGDIVAAYRDAFDRLVRDEDFLARARRMSEDLTPTRHSDVALLVGKLAAVTDAADAYLKELLRKNGVNVR